MTPSSGSVQPLAPTKTAGCAGLLGCLGAPRGRTTPWTLARYARLARGGKHPRRDGSQAQLLFSTLVRTARHGRRKTVKKKVKADPGLQLKAAGLGRRPNYDEVGRRKRFCHPREQKYFEIAGPLDDVSMG